MHTCNLVNLYGKNQTFLSDLSIYFSLDNKILSSEELKKRIYVLPEQSVKKRK